MVPPGRAVPLVEPTPQILIKDDTHVVAKKMVGGGGDSMIVFLGEAVKLS